MTKLAVGDLVVDKLNDEKRSYGIGVVLGIITDHPSVRTGKYSRPYYKVYFNKFKKTIEFAEEYLERISKD